MKGASDELRAHLCQGLSNRGVEMLKEDLEALGPVKIKEVDAAQQQIISTVRIMEKEGVISLADSPAEQYI